jgi:hypothetical protein
MERQEVYKVIDDERDYQDTKWPKQQHGNHEVEAYLLYMEHYLSEARRAVSTSDGTSGALEQMRKVVALGVACFEKHGVSYRFWPEELNKL